MKRWMGMLESGFVLVLDGSPVGIINMLSFFPNQLRRRVFYFIFPFFFSFSFITRRWDVYKRLNERSSGVDCGLWIAAALC